MIDLIQWGFDLFLNLDKHLDLLIRNFGLGSYAVLFLVIFCETGLVVTPFLPGDSLLFAVGTFAARGSFDLGLIMVSLSIAAILGDTVNYWIGSVVGPKVFSKEKSRWFNKKHLERTRRFYEKHGGKTIIIARFVPIIRTFAPFVAGIGRMSYGRFLTYNVVGGIFWICSCTLAGYLFGNIPIVKNNFSLVVMAIIAISLTPLFVEYLRARFGKKEEAIGSAP